MRYYIKCRLYINKYNIFALVYSKNHFWISKRLSIEQNQYNLRVDLNTCKYENIRVKKPPINQ